MTHDPPVAVVPADGAGHWAPFNVRLRSDTSRSGCAQALFLRTAADRLFRGVAVTSTAALGGFASATSKRRSQPDRSREQQFDGLNILQPLGRFGPPYPNNSTALLRRVAAQDASALEVIFDQHAAAVLGMALRLEHDAAAAEALVVTTFRHLWRVAGTFDPDRLSLRTRVLLTAYSSSAHRCHSR